MYKSEKEKLTAKIARKYVNGAWKWTGEEFRNAFGERIGDAWIPTYISWRYGKLRATVDAEAYGMGREVREFEGDDAFRECFSWIAEETMRLSEIVNARVKPYEEGKRGYEMALKGIAQ